MTARFAGSRSLDDRRRRRLAAEGDDAPLCGAAAAQPASTREFSALDRRPTIRIPVQKIVARRAWKVWLIALAAYAVCAAIVAAGVTVPRWERVLGPGMAALFEGAGGRVARLYSTLLLLSSSQLALLIWWVRSRSPRDFSGQYRIWSWASAVFFLAGCTLITDAHHAWSETVLWVWRTDFRHHAMLAWLTPVALTLGMLFWSLLGDLGQSRAGAAFLYLAAGGGLCASVLAFEPFHTLDSAHLTAFRQTALLTACASLFSALLLHARYVAYLSADPPQPNRSRLRARLRHIRLPRLRLPSLGWRRRTSASAVPSPPDADAPAAHKPARSAKAEKKPAAKKAAARSGPAENVAADTFTASEPAAKPPAAREPRPAEAVRPVAEAVQPKAEAPPKPSAAANKPAPAATPKSAPIAAADPIDRAEEDDDDEGPAARSGTDSGDRQYRIDGPDKSMLKGLSKRERRKLQQEWRERERAARRG